MQKTKKTKNKKNVNVTCEVVTAVKSFCADERVAAQERLLEEQRVAAEKKKEVGRR